MFSYQRDKCLAPNNLGARISWHDLAIHWHFNGFTECPGGIVSQLLGYNSSTKESKSYFNFTKSGGIKGAKKWEDGVSKKKKESMSPGPK